MRRLRLLGPCLALLALVAGAPAADAAQPTLWACHPQARPNPCTAPLTTTVLASTAQQPRRVVGVRDSQPAADAPVDCFYVYPTISTAPTLTAPLRVRTEVREITRWQASQYAPVCRMFAPVYRQITLAGLFSRQFGLSPGADAQVRAARDRAYGDVRDAWREYLATANEGRGVILIGHSQGAGVLTRLLDEQIEDDAAQRARIVAAHIVGGGFAVPRGQVVGGDLDRFPLCTAARQAGCVVAFSMFGATPSPRTSLFGRIDPVRRAAGGRPVRDDLQVACVNPIALTGAAVLEPLTLSLRYPGELGLASELLFPGLAQRAATPWVRPGERYRATCEAPGGVSVLRVRAADPASRLPASLPTPDWGLHVGEMNLAMGDLVRLAADEAAAWRAQTG